ncbi:MAG: hypothetical protein IPM91_00695 [Bacteroidetes bacterium]|nr:hypothetical protein [Bacteroidota bacterium]
MRHLGKDIIFPTHRPHPTYGRVRAGVERLLVTKMSPLQGFYRRKILETREFFSCRDGAAKKACTVRNARSANYPH